VEYVVEIFPVAHGKTAPPKAAQANTQPPFFLESRYGAGREDLNLCPLVPNFDVR